MSDDRVLTIREMCDLFGVTSRTLRFYESKELLFPERQGQKRLYSRRDRGRLKLVLRGKRFGFSLEEIRQLLNLYNKGDRQLTQFTKTYELAQKRLDILEKQSDDLNASISELREQMKSGEEMINSVRQSQEGMS